VPAAATSTTFTPVASTQMPRKPGSAASVWALSGVLLVSTMSAPCARSTISSGADRSNTEISPSAATSVHGLSPGLKVNESSTTIRGSTRKLSCDG